MSRYGNYLGDAFHVTAQLYNSQPASCIAAFFVFPKLFQTPNT